MAERDYELTVERVRLDRGGYTSSGRYYGTGAPLFSANFDDYSQVRSWETRAKDRAHAIELAKRHFGLPPDAPMRGGASRAQHRERLSKSRSEGRQRLSPESLKTLTHADKAVLASAVYSSHPSVFGADHLGRVNRAMARAAGVPAKDVVIAEKRMQKAGYLDAGSTLTRAGQAAIKPFYDHVAMPPWRVRLPSGKVIDYSEAEKPGSGMTPLAWHRAGFGPTGKGPAGKAPPSAEKHERGENPRTLKNILLKRKVASLVGRGRK
jgi:hypothetical protein